jgi:hypothetical protein
MLELSASCRYACSLLEPTKSFDQAPIHSLPLCISADIAEPEASISDMAIYGKEQEQSCNYYCVPLCNITSDITLAWST